MKTLKLETVVKGLENSENILYKNSINNFMNDLVREMLFTDKVDPMDEFFFNLDGFNNSFIRKYEFNIGLTEGICLKVKCEIEGEAEYNDCDESEVGLGAKGDFSGIKESYIEIKEILFYLHDGSEFIIDINNNNDITEYITNRLKIY